MPNLNAGTNMHARTYVHARTRTHMHKHTNMNVHPHKNTPRVRAPTNSQTHKCKHKPAQAQTQHTLLQPNSDAQLSPPTSNRPAQPDATLMSPAVSRRYTPRPSAKPRSSLNAHRAADVMRGSRGGCQECGSGCGSCGSCCSLCCCGSSSAMHVASTSRRVISCTMVWWWAHAKGVDKNI